ncbi:MAG: hypothetical protein H7329_02820 [Opitutaceae bacterium]|nr:hypothetical protein [Cytophagales bacterium]
MVVISSCKQQNLIPNLVIGTEEQAWRDTIKSMLNRGELNVNDKTDSLSFSYRFKTGDQTLNTGLTINGDGIGNGKLRVISFDFANSDGIRKADPNSSDPNYPSPSEDSALYDKLAEEVFMYRNTEGRIIGLSGSAFSLTSFNNLFSFLKRSYSGPDSILDNHSNRVDTIDFSKHVKDKADSKKFGDVRDYLPPANDKSWMNKSVQDKSLDTSSLKYFFHNVNSVFVLERSQFYEPNYFIPFIHSSSARLTQFSKTYDLDFQKEQEVILKTMRPADLITIPLYYDIEKKSGQYGMILTYLMVRANLDPNLRKTFAETREIESMKGKILVRDKYGTLLQPIPDIEIQANGSLPARGNPGKDYALGIGRGIRYNMYRYGLGIYVGHKDISYALKQAVNMGSTLSIEFVPDAIMFTDGSVLK